MHHLAAKIPPKAPANPVYDFTRYIVKKPWGNEYLLYQNEFVQIWNLFIEHGKSTSMHCHPNKKTGLILIEGEAMFSQLSGNTRLEPFDAVVIEAGAFHKTIALNEGGATVLEVETPPAKHDLIRLQDAYGRENLAYEGLDQCILDEGQCVRFPAVVSRGVAAEQSLGPCQLSIRSISADQITEADLRHLANHDLVVILEGLIYGPKNDEIYGVAEFLQTRDIVKNPQAYRIFNLTVMALKGPKPVAAGLKGLFSKYVNG